ncbi:1-(5-phosphoribosyl)-5-[(5-phosphoribosylamino)methylideneamino]imidazole-4-carboxamide isomerase [Salirhabdus salicampi]|uniref:1-(5-phosphoribosyl)-5-[(5- phosphoribosylamino)methylideneamino]imidazole-4- carboxamide isomerase n=1 Tax=Salirhabdus salicampi TaxID=476102 RepID=UPI0020C5AF6B|nr:1-(5-phosphoribosyl)-5-[(5-phosphoribosylamino)methylideneamino]imidazole-4-carboxamide isomerase [Salirhabdus salicampi]MCP8616115.1 1-(5-phosphoribosyl)-5-[(5-phosphoribosylamino)methylideneamino]imidazole-4-carboxamide isomerase [Salirhabdus salicampi]
MIIFPAIDIRDGKAVRLVQGKYDQQDTYGDPVEMARKWVEKGATFLHIVDLDGALVGESKNLTAIKEIASTVDVPVQVGGGVRSIEKIEALLESGVSRVILGTSAILDDVFLKEAVSTFGEKIVVSIDAKKGYVATDGWTKTTDRKALTFGKELEALGVKTIVYTDIAKDGMLAGPNFEELQTMNDHLNIDVIASGGISTIEDIKTLHQLHLYGAIVGKALYTGKVELEEILKEV